jgi:hypothetical protein
MNERIKELAIESQLVYENDGQLLTNWMTCADLSDELKKFAELIVRECASRCEMSPYPHPNYSVAIKKHFGVEE